MISENDKTLEAFSRLNYKELYDKGYGRPPAVLQVSIPFLIQIICIWELFCQN